jgi:4-diphosphocytidyl-2-C-methyl-D-erythritol kinase
MRIDRVSSTQLRILAPAKVNLFLEVLGRRPDGFHEITTVMCPVTLFDELTIEIQEGDEIQLEVDIPASVSADSQQDPGWDIPATRENLVVRAVQAAREKTGTTQGCRIGLKKRIPASAGLGGGSSDAAAAVTGYLALIRRWDREIAVDVCQSLGSDIPFFLGDASRIGLALGTGRGERCELLSFAPTLEFVILHPLVGCATGAIYAGYQRRETPRTPEKIVLACESGQFHKIGAELFNGLQLTAIGGNPWIARQLDILAECGFPYRLMSGSGSSCFAIANGTDRAAEIVRRAGEIGIPRTFFAGSWFAPPIEQQLSHIVD